MLEFLTGVFIILLSIFFLFISSNKQIEYKKNELNNKIVKKENINKNTDNIDIVADISDGEKKSGEINKDIINSEKNKSNTKENENIDSKDKGDNKENISIEKQDTNQKKLEDKKNQEKIEFRKKEMMTKLGFIEESYLNIEKKDDKSFAIFMQKAIKVKRDLDTKKAQEEKARKQALLEQEKAKQEQIKKELEAKKQAQNKNSDNIYFSKYVSLKKSTKDKFQVFIYKNGKVEEKWISRNLSPIKQTINLVLKNSGISLKGVILKNGNLTIKVDNKNNLNEVLSQELLNTAKFFPQVKNVIIQ